MTWRDFQLTYYQAIYDANFNNLFTQAWIFDKETEEFRETTPPSIGRHANIHGPVRSADGSNKIILAGGVPDDDADYATCEIFDPEDETWSECEATPNYWGGGGSAPYGDSFLAVGGRLDVTTYTNEIWR